MRKRLYIIGLILAFMFIVIQTKAGHEKPIADTDCEELLPVETVSIAAPQVSCSAEPETTTPTVTTACEYPEFTYSRDWDSHDTYLLARIAMAEAEGESIESKEYVILTVLNRVWSDDFPGTIEDVIFEESNGVYQFSCIGNGRWDDCLEPNPECFEAVWNVQGMPYDISEGALYFECCEDEDNWHSKNLEYLYTSDNIRFYK